MNTRLPRIYPITDTSLSGLSHLAQAELLIAGGARLIQLRDKRSMSAEFFRSAVETVKYAEKRGTLIIINDRVDIALLSGADGVHLGQDDLPAEAARRILGERAIIGLSTHSVEQVRAAVKLPIDYLAIGPIFSTTTKDKPDLTVGLEGIKIAKQAAKGIPLVAIGGINSENLTAVLEAGANSAAVISCVIGDPARIMSRMQNLWTQAGQ